MMATYETIVGQWAVHLNKRAQRDWEAECRARVEAAQRKTQEELEAQLRARLC